MDINDQKYCRNFNDTQLKEKKKTYRLLQMRQSVISFFTQQTVFKIHQFKKFEQFKNGEIGIGEKNEKKFIYSIINGPDISICYFLGY